LAYIQLAPHSLYSREKLPALGLVVFGILVTICGAAVLIPNLLGDCRSGIVMGYCVDESHTNATVAPTLLRRTTTKG
jgi:solute carrier family 38 (sodium-coupled neutral amino acid transporter), member 11